MNCRFVKVDEIFTNNDGVRRVNFHYLGEVEGDNIVGTCRGIDYAWVYPDFVDISVYEVINLERGPNYSVRRTGRGLIDDSGRITVERGYCCLEKTDGIYETQWSGLLNQKQRDFAIEVFHDK